MRPELHRPQEQSFAEMATYYLPVITVAGITVLSVLSLYACSGNTTAEQSTFTGPPGPTPTSSFVSERLQDGISSPR